MTRRLLAKFLPVLLASGLAVAAAHADEAATTKTFDGWTATCNNLNACVALATAPDDLFYVRIARDAGATAAPLVKIVLAAQEPLKGSGPAFRLVANDDGRKEALGPFPAKAPDQDSSILFATLAEGPSLAFINAIRPAATLDYSVMATRGTLDLKGLAAALRFIDAQQGRQGTPTALVARGMTPIGQVPPPPPAPVVAAAPSDGASTIDKPSIPKALIDAATPVCDAEAVADQSDAEAWHLGADTTLYALTCTQGAYNTVSALYLVDAAGGAPKPVALPRPAALRGDSADNVAENVGFDPKTMTLSAFGKGRGLGDCGSSASWLWDGHSFALLEASLLDACPGALPEDWPSIYSARRK